MGDLKKNEDVYIAREELDKKKKKIAKQQAEMAAAEKKNQQELHYMHCPKCGSKLVEIGFRDVMIDKCTGCQGVWLDTGELEQVTKDKSFLDNMLEIFK